MDLKPGEQEVVVSKLLEYSQQLCTLLHEPITDESPEGLLLMGSIGQWHSEIILYNSNNIHEIAEKFSYRQANSSTNSTTWLYIMFPDFSP